MLHVSPRSINLIEFEGNEYEYIAIRGEDKNILICSPPQNGGVFPHVVLYDRERDLYKKIASINDIEDIDFESNEIEWNSEIPDIKKYFFIKKGKSVRPGFNVTRLYNGILYRTSYIVMIDYYGSRLKDSFKTVHIDCLRDCLFSCISGFKVSNVSDIRNTHIDTRAWSGDLDRLFKGKLFLSDILKEALLLIDSFEGGIYREGIEVGLENVFGRERVIGENSLTDISGLYNERRDDAIGNMFMNDAFNKETVDFLNKIEWKRESVVSTTGLDYLRNLWLTSDRYINDLGL